eukprot:11771886-Alexandrium_andersonii.AAC.1
MSGMQTNRIWCSNCLRRRLAPCRCCRRNAALRCALAVVLHHAVRSAGRGGKGFLGAERARGQATRGRL